MGAAALPCRIDDIPTSAYPTPAQRPANSRMDCSATKAVFGIDRPDWQADLTDMVARMSPAPSASPNT
jgi:dTDP-4-dehydrorhamnose reductase